MSSYSISISPLMTFLASISDWDRYQSKWTRCELHKMQACSYQGGNGWDSWQYSQHAMAILANLCTFWLWISKSWQAESRPVVCFGYHIPPSVIGPSLVSCWSRKFLFWEVPPNSWCDHVSPLCYCDCLFPSHFQKACRPLLEKHAFVSQQLKGALPRVFPSS